MKNSLKLEEFGQLLLSVCAFIQLDYAWWLFPISLFLPDLSIMGYAINTKVGAWLYNLFHHKLSAILVWGIGYLLHNSFLELVGIILYAHSSLDRMLGYGLKFNDDFKNTHLGWIGKK